MLIGHQASLLASVLRCDTYEPAFGSRKRASQATCLSSVLTVALGSSAGIEPKKKHAQDDLGLSQLCGN